MSIGIAGVYGVFPRSARTGGRGAAATSALTRARGQFGPVHRRGSRGGWGPIRSPEGTAGYVLIGKLAVHTARGFAERAIQLIRAQVRPVYTITADNGAAISGYRLIERRTETRFFFATPYDAKERGTNENTNGLIRQYLPQGQSMAGLTQRDCLHIARHLNQRPRTRLGYRTPEECYEA
jgi:transposase, IS30 family